MAPPTSTEDLFAALGFERDLTLAPDAIESAWRERTRERSSPAEATAENATNSPAHLDVLHRARDVLRDPVSRLGHWLELAGSSVEHAGSMDADLVALFGEVGAVLGKADDLIERHGQADSAVARALLTRDLITVQQDLQGVMGRLREAIDSIVDRFPDWQVENTAAGREEAHAGLQRLRFLAKWEGECRNRMLALAGC